jgi:hypothetical protein
MVPRIPSGSISATGGGGGWIRRYWRFQETMWRRMWETKDIHPYAPVALFDFTRSHDVADARHVSPNRQYDGWRIADDRVIGGYSHATANLIQTTRDLYKYSSTPRHQYQQQSITAAGKSTIRNVEKSDLNENDDDDGEDHHEPLARPFLRWTGHLDTTIGMSSRAQRSGFAALKSPEFSIGNGANLRGAYSALEIVCRTDGRVYTVQLQIGGTLMSPSSGGDGVNVFKGHIDVEATTPSNTTTNYIGEQGDDYGNEDQQQLQQHQQPQQYWDVLYLPFADFSLSDKKSSNDRQLDDKVCIESIGFTLMDGKDGPFCFDLARIRAVNFYNGGGVWEGIEQQQRNHDNKR